MKCRIPLSLSIFFMLLVAGRLDSAFAQWSHDPNANTAISTANDQQSYSVMVSDGAGGAIIAWHDFRSGSNYDIYAQRINAAGEVQWASDGVAICTAAGTQEFPTIAGDGSGGAVITWEDYRSVGTASDIYVQRVNSSGAVQWTANGVVACASANNQRLPMIAGDGTGGAIVTWYDLRSSTSNDVYVQRINNLGTAQWSQNGVVISAAASEQLYPSIAADGIGGAIIAWQDARGANNDIYAQRINSSGVVQWTADGAGVCKAFDHQYSPVLVSDGAGGAIITWYDYRNGTYTDLYAQRIDGSGTPLWTVDGVVISAAGNNQSAPVISGDGAGGAIIAWNDFRSVTSSDIYAQRVNALGAPLWTGYGVPVASSAYVEQSPAVAGDGTGGALVVWIDARNGSNDIYAQRLSSSGTLDWSTYGVPISTAASNQQMPSIVTNGSGGAVISWVDGRSGNNDIFAQGVDKIGSLGKNEPAITKVKDVAGDQGGKVSVIWNASSFDVYPYSTIKTYTVWRGIEPASLPTAGGIMDGVLSASSRVRSTTTDGITTSWEAIGSVNAHYFGSYSFSAPTLADSGTPGNAKVKFLVSAETNNQYVFWDSNVDSGYSIDNLSPSAVPSLTARLRSGPSVSLTWPPNGTDPDVGFYEIHRSAVNGFVPAPATRLGIATDTTFTDSSPLSGQTNYYRLITVDIHGNWSAPSPQASSVTTATQFISYVDKWNLVSVPLGVSDYAKATLFPTAVSNAFAFHGSYSAEPVLANGGGYWVKLNGAQSVSMTGYLRDIDTVNLTTGWNIIGSISQAISLAQVSITPANITVSPLFGYDGSYHQSTTIEPGKGYWLKVKQPGKLILSSSSNQPGAGMFNIENDSAEPPPPPGSEVMDLYAGIPKEFALAQNYPNPFNPTTTIPFELPEESFVTLKVYDGLGQEIATLINGMEKAGYRTAAWDASSISSGVYYYRLTAGSFTSMKKLVLLR